jgi:hypothetical protein
VDVLLPTPRVCREVSTQSGGTRFPLSRTKVSVITPVLQSAKGHGRRCCSRVSTLLSVMCRRACAGAMGCGASSCAGAYAKHDDAEDEVSSVLATALRTWSLRPTDSPPQRDAVTTNRVFCPSTRGELAGVLRASPKLSSYVDNERAPAADVGGWLRALGGTLTHDFDLASEVPLSLLPSVLTSTDVFVTDLLGGVLHRLVRGEFRGHANGHSCVLIGPRGSGKTYALRRIALTASVRYESLRVVYVTAKHVAEPSHPLRDGLCSLILGLNLLSQRAAVPTSLSAADASDAVASGCSVAVASADIDASSERPSTVDALMCHLISQKLRLLVILDEMEALYEAKEEFAHKVVLELAALADIDSGRTAVVGCSSSSLLYPLVQGGRTARMPPELRSTHFPLADAFHLTNMNDQKMTLQEIPLPPPMGGKDVAAFCSPGSGESAARVVAFVLGCNVRRLYKREFPRPLYAPVPSLDNVEYAKSFRSAPQYGCMPDLLAMMYDVLGAQNEDLLKRVLRAAPPAADVLHTLDAQAIGAINWPQSFTPLSSSTTWALARVLQAQDGLDEVTVNAMLDFLHHDASVIVLLRGASMDDFAVFPSCVLAVVLHLRWRQRQLFTLRDVAQSAVIAARDGPHWLMRNASVANNWKKTGEELGSLLKAVAARAPR